MKKSLALFTAALWPVAVLAQNAPKAVPVPAGTPAPVPAATTPTPPAQGQDPFGAPAVPALLDRVEFQDHDLPFIIEYLKGRNEELGGNQRDLNIIVSPGLEKLKVPTLSLRNVTVTDVLTVVTTVLNVQLEPVVNRTTGENVAWIVKSPAGDSETTVLNYHTITGLPANLAATWAAGTPGTPGPDALPGTAPGPGGDTIQFTDPTAAPSPKVVELASGGGGLAANNPSAAPETPARPATKVLGIAALVLSTKANAQEREDDRRLKFAILVDQLQKLANEEAGKTEIRAYNNLEIIVVKSPHAEGINLISEAVEALKTNAAADRASQVLPGSEKPAEKPGAH